MNIEECIYVSYVGNELLYSYNVEKREPTNVEGEYNMGLTVEY